MIIFFTSSTVAGVKEASREFTLESPLVQDLKYDLEKQTRSY